MKKTIRTIEVSVIIGILLFSIFAAFIPSVSAVLIPSQPIIKLEPVNPEDLNQLVNIKDPIKIPIKITYTVTGTFSSIAIPIFESRNMVAPISLSVQDPGAGISASIDRNVVNPKIKSGESSDTAILSVTFTEAIVGRFDVPIKIQMNADKVSGLLFYIEAKQEVGTITIAPQYIPIVSIVPRTTLKEVAPGEVAEFLIDLENLGNDITEFVFRMGDLPEGWVANTVPAIKVPSALGGGNNKATVSVSVTPPYGFGYHNNDELIKVYAKGRYYAKTTGDLLETEEYEIQLQVRNRGFSTPGFEGVFVIIALVGIALIVKKLKKTK